MHPFGGASNGATKWIRFSIRKNLIDQPMTVEMPARLLWKLAATAEPPNARARLVLLLDWLRVVEALFVLL
jgi:hypothetical protein